jgi:hypothetical protein
MTDPPPDPKPESLPVLFRRDSEGRITAVFPTLPSDLSSTQLTVYEHVGQHGSACWDWLRRTRPAQPDEYASLLQELRSIYERSLAPGDPVFRLKVCQRISPQHRLAFHREARRLRQLS